MGCQLVRMDARGDRQRLSGTTSRRIQHPDIRVRWSADRPGRRRIRERRLLNQLSDCNTAELSSFPCARCQDHSSSGRDFLVLYLLAVEPVSAFDLTALTTRRMSL